MPHMSLKVLKIFFTQGMTMDNEQILSISIFCGLGEVKAASDDYLPVDDHYLVMGNGVCVIDIPAERAPNKT